MSPRLEAQDVEHAQALAHMFDACPPIVVEQDTNVVIDGVHRLLAARLLGQSTIRVRYFAGSHAEAYVEAVRSNIAHGKPLSISEREAAAKKVLTLFSGWSDRKIGEACGLSGKTIGKLRRTTEDIPQLPRRIGRDGRERPVHAESLRNQIADELIRHPDIQSGDLARKLATSPSTVRDVRRHLQEDNVDRPNHQQRSTDIDGKTGHSTTPIRHRWSSDQAILSSTHGPEVAQWLDRTSILPTEWQRFIDSVPLGRIPELIAAARERSEEWLNFASALDDRGRHLARVRK